MNTSKLLAILLCFATCIATTTTFADEDDDFGIESATPIVVADPINPQPGMVCSAYLFGHTNGEDNWRKTISRLANAPSIKSYVDKEDSFNRNALSNSTQTNIMKWEGYIKCKRAGMYSFSFVGPHSNFYAFYLNDVEIISAGYGQMTVGGQLKEGWNKVVIIVEIDHPNQKLELKYKPNESLAEPRPLTPKKMFHDEKPEEDWED